jgi:hypothetical protein
MLNPTLNPFHVQNINFRKTTATVDRSRQPVPQKFQTLT